MIPPVHASAENSAASSSANAPAALPVRTSRLERFFNFVIRHAGSVAVDHTHLLPLDRVSGRTGITKPQPTRACCC